MNMKPDKNDMNDEEIDFVEIWNKVKTFVVKCKYWIVVTPVLFVFFGFALSELVAPQWGAVILMQIGKISKSELVESVDTIVSRLGSSEFQDLVLADNAAPMSEREKKLYRASLNGRQFKAPNLIEIKVKGFSKESAAGLAAITAEKITESHSAAISAARIDFGKKLTDIEKKNKIIGTVIGRFSNASIATDALAGLVAMYLSEEIENCLSEVRRNLTGVSPTVAVGIKVEATPVYPKKYIWISLSGLLGLFLGIAIPWVLNCIEKNKYRLK